MKIAFKVFHSVLTIMILKHYWKRLWYMKTLLLTISFFFFLHWVNNRDGERINLCNYAHCLEADCICKSSSENLSWDVPTRRTAKVTLQLRRGFYHDRYRDIAKVSFLIYLSIDGHSHTHPHTLKLMLDYVFCTRVVCLNSINDAFLSAWFSFWP